MKAHTIMPVLALALGLALTSANYATESYWDYNPILGEFDYFADSSFPMEGINHFFAIGMTIPNIISISPGFTLAHTFPTDEDKGSVAFEGGVSLFKNYGEDYMFTPVLSWWAYGGDEEAIEQVYDEDLGETNAQTNTQSFIVHEFSLLFQVNFNSWPLAPWLLPGIIYENHDQTFTGRASLGLGGSVVPDVFDIYGMGTAYIPFDGSPSYYAVDIEFDAYIGNFSPVLDVTYNIEDEGAYLNLSLGVVITLSAGEDEGDEER